MLTSVVTAIGPDYAPIAYLLDYSKSVHKKMDKEKPGIKSLGNTKSTIEAVHFLGYKPLTAKDIICV